MGLSTANSAQENVGEKTEVSCLSSHTHCVPQLDQALVHMGMLVAQHHIGLHALWPDSYHTNGLVQLREAHK